MRAEQYDKLKAISEQLLDVAAIELDAASWPGAGKKPAKLTRDERGDRYWCKKNAAATLTLLTKIATLTGIQERRSIVDPPEEPQGIEEPEDLDAEIASAEREARGIIERIQRQQRPTKRRTK